jgi:hypothetical protein
MKKFILKVFTFGIVIFVFLILLDFCISFHFRKSTSRIFSGWAYIYNTDETIYNDIIINGNSRAWVQYSPNILDDVLGISSYNLGIDGSGINRQIIKFNKYIERHGVPKILIQNIDLFTMAPSYGYEREQFYPYFFYDRTLLNDVDIYENFSYMEKNLPGYRYYGLNQTIFEKLEYFPLMKGYAGSDSPWNGTILAEMSAVSFNLDRTMLLIFREFLEKVTSYGTKVIFVYAPIYYEVNDKCVNIEHMYNTYQCLANEFDIPILDYNDIPMCYDTTYFYNATHLNRVGAELFTTKLAHDIDSLGLLK